MVKQYPILYSKDSKGKRRQWEVFTEGADVVVVYGLCGGSHVVDRKTCVGKNLGKANETTAEQQATKEAQALWEAKKKRKYTEDVGGESGVFKPMLAKVYADNESKVQYPCFVQPKLDGVRCIAKFSNNEWSLFSRDYQPLNIPHITEELPINLPDGTILDGELYKHGVEFSTLVSWVKDVNNESRLNLEYWIYDTTKVTNDKREFFNRLTILNIINDELTANGKVKSSVVKTTKCNSFVEVQAMFALYLEQGYEGLMIRNANGLYKNGRSSDLLKLKEFDDDEFLVVGATTGVGREAGSVIWKCVTKDNIEFDCRPTGTLEERAEYLKNSDKYIGKKLTVQFFGYGSNGRPRFPVGKGFRFESTN